MTIENLYRDNYRIVYGYLFSLCKDRAAAEDLTSETFLRAIEKPNAWDGRGKASTWLCTIGRNLFLNETRRNRRFTSLEEAEPRTSESFEESVGDRDEAGRILKAAESLDEDKRQVLFMRTRGLSFREIGDALDRTENWARVTFFRVKNAVLDKLEGQDE